MKKALALLAFILGLGAAQAATVPLSVNVAGTTFLLPLQKVKATQLYSFRDRKGYVAPETVIAGWGSPDMQGDRKVELTFGAAPVLGSDKNVPFLGIQTRLPEAHFDTSNNTLQFGAWVGKESDQKRATWGVKASVALW